MTLRELLDEIPALAAVAAFGFCVLLVLGAL